MSTKAKWSKGVTRWTRSDGAYVELTIITQQSPIAKTVYSTSCWTAWNIVNGDPSALKEFSTPEEAVKYINSTFPL